jgi:hypothetical protein
MHMSRGSGRFLGFLLYVPDLLEGRVTVLLWSDFAATILLFPPRPVVRGLGWRIKESKLYLPLPPTRMKAIGVLPP